MNKDVLGQIRTLQCLIKLCTMQINMRSVITLVQKAKEHLIKTKGEIINVSSIASGPHGVSERLILQKNVLRSLQDSQMTYYGMSKADLNHFTRSSAISLIQHGVRVNSVSPGFTLTGFGDAMGFPPGALEKVNPSLYATYE